MEFKNRPYKPIVKTRKWGRKGPDLYGQKFGRLTVIRQELKSKYYDKEWLCKCTCGEKTIVRTYNLVYGKTKSCGCLNYSAGGAWNTRLYARWSTMKNKCYNPKAVNYARFGGRGIKVCERWRKDFKEFKRDMGEIPEGRQLARRDTNKDFEPNNCYWATPEESHVNNPNAKRRIIEFKGEFKPVSEWAELTGLSSNLIFSRINRGWPVEKALTKPPHRKPVKKEEVQEPLGDAEAKQEVDNVERPGESKLERLAREYREGEENGK